MTKVCHVTSVHTNSDVRIFEKECTSLAKKKEYDVYFVAPGKTFVKNNVNIVGIGEKPISRLERFIFFSRKAYKTALDLDAEIYHIHDPELLRFALKIKKKGKKVIYDSHEDTVEDISRKDYIPYLLRNVITKMFKKYLNNVVAKIDAIITVTPRIVDKFSKVNKNVFLVTNYPIVDSASIVEKTSMECNETTTLCFAGGIDPMWSHEYILRAINSLDNVKYTLFGAGDESYLDKLRMLPGWNKVDYRGRVPFNVVNEELWNADIGIALCQYVLDKNNEGTLGNTKLFEEMLHALPVIATDYTLWAEIVEGEKCGICVNPTDVGQIRDAIVTLIQNPELAKEMGQNGKAAVIKKYNWCSQESILFEVYSILQGKVM